MHADQSVRFESFDQHSIIAVPFLTVCTWKIMPSTYKDHRHFSFSRNCTCKSNEEAISSTVFAICPPKDKSLHHGLKNQQVASLCFVVWLKKKKKLVHLFGSFLGARFLLFC